MHRLETCLLSSTCYCGRSLGSVGSFLPRSNLAADLFYARAYRRHLLATPVACIFLYSVVVTFLLCCPSLASFYSFVVAFLMCFLLAMSISCIFLYSHASIVAILSLYFYHNISIAAIFLLRWSRIDIDFIKWF